MKLHAVSARQGKIGERLLLKTMKRPHNFHSLSIEHKSSSSSRSKIITTHVLQIPKQLLF